MWLKTDHDDWTWDYQRRGNTYSCGFWNERFRQGNPRPAGSVIRIDCSAARGWQMLVVGEDSIPKMKEATLAEALAAAPEELHELMLEQHVVIEGYQAQQAQKWIDRRASMRAERMAAA